MIHQKLIIKLFFIFIIFIILVNANKNVIYIECDNIISDYEYDIDFSGLKTNIKAIALYLPQFHETKINNKFWGKGFTEWTNVKKSKPRFKGHNQPRIPLNESQYLGYYDLSEIKTIENQIRLAKSHGIYGFGIYYYWFSGKKVLQKPINIFLKHSYIEFHFLLIWANENWTKRWNGGDKEILIKQEYNSNDPENFIRDIKKYIIDKRYIKIDKRPILGLYEPSKIPNLHQTITIWREKSRDFGIGEIFILVCINKNQTHDLEKLNLFNASYEFPPRNSFENNRIPEKKTLIYSELIYKSSLLNETSLNLKKFPFFRGSMVEWDNSPRIQNYEIFDHYSPEQFYMFNKIIVNWTIQHYNKNRQFIFINAWNEWGEGSYLEPDDKYGYASINSLSKAIFNLPYSSNLTSIDKNKIAVLLYIHNKYSIEELVNKINNIPYLYDLFIYNHNNINVEKLNQYIKFNSNAYYFESELSFKKGENLLAFLYNFRNKAKNYKYICNINSNHYKDIFFLDEWKNYLHNNLLGDSNIISEIITDFEKNDKLGLIFPEKYYKSLIQFSDYISDLELNYLNLIFNKISPKTNIIHKLVDFPEGNMFWAKVSAIHQIFNLYSNMTLTRKTRLIIENNLENIWVFLAKINGFMYRKIFKHL